MTHKTKSSIIFPRNVRPGDMLRTSNGMREVRAVTSMTDVIYITVKDPMSDIGQTTLQFPVGRAAKVTVHRAPRKAVPVKPARHTLGRDTPLRSIFFRLALGAVE